MKQTNYQTYKKWLIVFSCVFLAGITTSFRGENGKNENKFNLKSTAILVGPEDLYTVYLNNAELKPLLTNANSSTVLLQFLNLQNNQGISLVAWSKRTARPTFVGKQDFHQAVPGITTPTLNVTKMGVHLGNIYIDGELYRYLLNKVNGSINDFTIFVPVIGSYYDGLAHITYRISGTSINPSTRAPLQNELTFTISTTITFPYDTEIKY